MQKAFLKKAVSSIFIFSTVLSVSAIEINHNQFANADSETSVNSATNNDLSNWLPDTHLQAAIADKLGIPVTELTPQSAQKFTQQSGTTLDLHGLGLTSLKGIVEYMNDSFTNVDLSDNPDLGPYLQSLPTDTYGSGTPFGWENTTSVNIKNTGITNTDFLNGTENLKFLNIQDNKFTGAGWYTWFPPTVVDASFNNSLSGQLPNPAYIHNEIRVDNSNYFDLSNAHMEDPSHFKSDKVIALNQNATDTSVYKYSKGTDVTIKNPVKDSYGRPVPVSGNGITYNAVDNIITIDTKDDPTSVVGQWNIPNFSGNITFNLEMNQDSTTSTSQGHIEINYLDKNGNKIADSTQLSGLVGTKYALSPKSIDGYSFKSADNSLSGDFTDEDQTVTLTYEKNCDSVNGNHSDNANSNGTADQSNNETKPGTSQNLANDSKVNLASLGNTKTNTSRSFTTWNSSSLPQGQQEDVLPSTGMKSTGWLTLIGIVMVLLSSFFVLKKTRHTR